MAHVGRQKRGGTRGRQGTTRRGSTLPGKAKAKGRAINKKSVARLAAAAKFVDALGLHQAQFEMSGSNLHEITQKLIAGTDPANIQNGIESAIQQYRADLARVKKIHDELKEFVAIWTAEGKRPP
jgi:hypothetical protein